MIAFHTTDGANFSTVDNAVRVSCHTFCSTSTSTIRLRVRNQEFHFSRNGATNTDTAKPMPMSRMRSGSATSANIQKRLNFRSAPMKSRTA